MWSVGASPGYSWPLLQFRGRRRRSITDPRPPSKLLTPRRLLIGRERRFRSPTAITNEDSDQEPQQQLNLSVLRFTLGKLFLESPSFAFCSIVWSLIVWDFRDSGSGWVLPAQMDRHRLRFAHYPQPFVLPFVPYPCPARMINWNRLSLFFLQIGIFPNCY